MDRDRTSDRHPRRPATAIGGDRHELSVALERVAHLAHGFSVPQAQSAVRLGEFGERDGALFGGHGWHGRQNTTTKAPIAMSERDSRSKIRAESPAWGGDTRTSRRVTVTLTARFVSRVFATDRARSPRILALEGGA